MLTQCNAILQSNGQSDIRKPISSNNLATSSLEIFMHSTKEQYQHQENVKSKAWRRKLWGGRRNSALLSLDWMAALYL